MGSRPRDAKADAYSADGRGEVVLPSNRSLIDSCDAPLDVEARFDFGASPNGPNFCLML
jgi:hypothetical protein